MTRTNTQIDDTIISDLKKRVTELEEENSTLWSMIDDIWTSDVKEHAEVMHKAHADIVLKRFVQQL